MPDKNTDSIAAINPAQSPWSIKQRVAMLVWEYSWALLCAWTPKPFNAWRLLWLRLFGARILGTPFVHQRARIQIPWHITLHDLSCLGDRANLYSLGKIEIGCGAVIAQEAYLCTGTHDFRDPALPVITSAIFIGKDAFVGARAFILPGVRIGEGAIIGAGSLVSADIAAYTVNVGNPCRFLRNRNSGTVGSQRTSSPQ